MISLSRMVCLIIEFFGTFREMYFSMCPVFYDVFANKNFRKGIQFFHSHTIIWLKERVSGAIQKQSYWNQFSKNLVGYCH